jgi:hypothetical protein
MGESEAFFTLRVFTDASCREEEREGEREREERRVKACTF